MLIVAAPWDDRQPRPATRDGSRVSARRDGTCEASAPGHTSPVEKFREWFGTPVAAAKTLIWLWWVGILISVLVSLLYFAARALLAALD